jgi:hypothetical protein
MCYVKIAFAPSQGPAPPPTHFSNTIQAETLVLVDLTVLRTCVLEPVVNIIQTLARCGASVSSTLSMSLFSLGGKAIRSDWLNVYCLLSRYIGLHRFIRLNRLSNYQVVTLLRLQ